MFIYLLAPINGTVTIFDFIYDGPQKKGGRWSTSMQLNLNDSHLMFNMKGPDGENFGTAVIDSVLPTKQWIPLSVVHVKDNGNIKLYNNDSTGPIVLKDNPENVILPLPARLKLAGSYTQGNPFEGCITCFAIYNFKFPNVGFASYIKNCRAENFKPKEIGIKVRKLRKAYACSAAKPTEDRCSLLNISCGGDRIRIRRALYGFPYTLCEDNQPECGLRRTEPIECCTEATGDVMKPLEEYHYYAIHKACSGQKRCSPQTPVGTDDNKTNSSYSVIYYECQEATNTVHLCRNESLSGKSLNIIFKGLEIERDNPDECVCHLHTSDRSEGYRISAPDLRLQSESGGCSSETVISGLTDENIKCVKRLTKIVFFNRNDTSDIKLSFTKKPEFIWIIAEAKGLSQISARCFLSKDNDAKSKTFPVAAIAVPLVLLLLLGTGIAFFWFRKRKGRKPKESYSPVKTADNQMELDPENPCNYISHPDSTPSGRLVDEAANTTEVGNEIPERHNCFVLEKQNSHSSYSESIQPDILPHDTYSSINTDADTIQTLPENEYNVLSMARKPTTRDQNYGTLRSAGLRDPHIENNSEYSHIQMNCAKKQDMNEYSHTAVSTSNPTSSYDTDVVYLHINSVLSNPIENNEYSQVDVRLG